MKQFLLFAGVGTADGGWNDFVDSFDDPTDAKLYAIREKFGWYHVIDSTTGDEY
ncbi:MAG: hypothetical protein KAJ40_08925 [Alphaproteobacteria bacterium]|nr:hypothetical protein [Alphaproteobacteria bacterium]